MKQTELIQFRLFKMPCCDHLLCWVNPRLPSYCPECGKQVFTALKFKGDSYILVNDTNARLTYNT